MEQWRVQVGGWGGGGGGVGGENFRGKLPKGGWEQKKKLGFAP
eukprot:COSAG04_NODE_9322_length_874_cov_1.904516_1_plen_42_part_10